MRKRTLAREYSLHVLYQQDITRMEIQILLDQLWEREDGGDTEITEFTRRLVLGVQQNVASLDEKISQYATNWQLKRMAIIDRNILRLGLYELLYAEDIPPKVSINEAVELAKKFGDLESSKFVNGILDKIHKTEIAQSS
ncbi:MAG: transcription antitermination factor NusB [Candidatus Omnitrophota bacterium]